MNGKTNPWRERTDYGEKHMEEFVKWAHERDGVVEVKKPESKMRVIPYEEVAARLHARKKQ